MTPVTSLLLGAIGGALACLGVGLKYKFGFDDSLDVVGVHLVAGLWGTIGLAFFASEGGMLTDDFGFGFQLLIVQVVIALVAMVFTAVVTAILGYILKAVMGWRIDSDSEESGIDEAQHHESSYDFESPEEGATPVLAGAAPKRVGPVEDEV